MTPTPTPTQTWACYYCETVNSTDDSICMACVASRADLIVPLSHIHPLTLESSPPTAAAPSSSRSSTPPSRAPAAPPPPSPPKKKRSWFS